MSLTMREKASSVRKKMTTPDHPGKQCVRPSSTTTSSPGAFVDRAYPAARPGWLDRRPVRTAAV